METEDFLEGFKEACVDLGFTEDEADRMADDYILTEVTQ